MSFDKHKMSCNIKTIYFNDKQSNELDDILYLITCMNFNSRFTFNGKTNFINKIKNCYYCVIIAFNTE